MTIEADRPMVERTDEASATTWVDTFVDAMGRGDIDSCAALVHDDVHIRVDGVDAAMGREGLADLLRRIRRARPDAGIRVIDTHVAGDFAYTLFTATAPESAPSERLRLLAYAILRMRDGRLDEASCFLDHVAPSDAVHDQHRPPEAVLDLRDATPAIELREVVALPPAPPRSRRRWRRLALPFAALGSWVVQDLLLAAPIVAFAARFGAGVAFALFAPLYTAISLVLSLVTIRLLGTPGATGHGRFARWLSSVDHHPFTLRLLRAGSVFGFLLSAYLLSGPPTVWALHHLGIRRSLTRWAILASVIWGVGFVLFYALVAEVVLG